MKRIGAVLLLLVLTRCLDQPVQPKLPEQQTSPKAQLELQSDGLYCTPSGATLTSGALFQVCFNPGNWNRDLIVFIPGYHDPARDPSLPELPDNLSETSVSLLFTALGYGFATTLFRSARAGGDGQSPAHQHHRSHHPLRLPDRRIAGRPGDGAGGRAVPEHIQRWLGRVRPHRRLPAAD